LPERDRPSPSFFINPVTIFLAIVAWTVLSFLSS
jgi:hypothetical protein